jgi:hypothetical protein
MAIIPQLKKTVIVVHRWIGTTLCLLFLLWFASGIGMMYWTYPSVSDEDRLRHDPPLDAGKINVSPEEAYEKLETNLPVNSTRIVMLDGRPAYCFRIEHRESVVYADTGEKQAGCSPELSSRIASAWTGERTAGQFETHTDQDQWTVTGNFKALLPLRKYSWPDGRQVYVSTVTCHVEQDSTRRLRLHAYLSAIPHWLYFTPIRKHTRQWSQVVIWTSGLGTVTAALGLVIGTWSYSPSKRYRYAGATSSIPFAGRKRWHMILGLTFGVVTCTWVFSGMLSMDPFPALQQGDPDVGKFEVEEALHGDAPPLSSFTAKPPSRALQEIADGFHARELRLTSVMGQSVYLATTNPQRTLIVPVLGRPTTEFDRQEIVDALRGAAKPFAITEVRLVTQYESYYIDRHKMLPLPVLLVRFSDPGQSTYYIDPKTARVIEAYNSHSRKNRWLYHGLHSMDFPWLYKSRPSWDLLLLLLLAGGSSLCVTSLLLSWNVLRVMAAASLRGQYSKPPAPHAN